MTSRRKWTFCEWEIAVLILRTIKFNWLRILHTIRNSNKSHVKNIQWFLPIPFSICQVRVSWPLSSQNAAFNDTRAPFNLFDISPECNFLLLFWRNVSNQLDFSQGPAYCPVTVAEFAVLIKIVTRLRGEVTRLSPCLIWRPDNVDILQWKTMEPLCRAATCHHPPAVSSPQLQIWSELSVPF